MRTFTYPTCRTRKEAKRLARKLKKTGKYKKVVVSAPDMPAYRGGIAIRPSRVKVVW